VRRPAHPETIAPYDAAQRCWRAVIDTPRGSRNKYKLDAATGLYMLGKPLPLGHVFPFDFGDIPSTKAGDGDPIDALVLMDEPVFVGCMVEVRFVGVIEAEQTEQGNTLRNDRLIAVALKSPRYENVKTLEDLREGLLDEVEHFFVSYNELADKTFEPLRRAGPRRATALVRAAMKRFASGA
jgi:inorganic pyrophosphatase